MTFKLAATSAALAVLLGCGGELLPHTPGADAGGGASDGGFLNGPPVYRPTIQADLESAGCMATACHGSAAVPMPLITAPSTADEWMGNYGEAKARAGSAVSSLLLDKAVGAGGHVPSLSASDPRLVRIAEWIAADTPYEAPMSGGGGDAGGTDAGEEDGGVSATITWNETVGPLMVSRNCVQCHGPSQTAGNYALDTYAKAKANGSDSIPNVIPGDPLSNTVVYFQQGHRGATAVEAQIVLDWVLGGALEQ